VRFANSSFGVFYFRCTFSLGLSGASHRLSISRSIPTWFDARVEDEEEVEVSGLDGSVSSAAAVLLVPEYVQAGWWYLLVSGTV